MVTPRHTPLRRWLTPVLTTLAVALLVGAPTTASAEPNPSGHDSDPPLLLDVLESTSRGYSQAKARLEKSEQRQKQLTQELTRVQARIDELAPQVAQIAAQSYRTGRVNAMAVLLNSSSPDTFVQRMTALDELNIANDAKVAALNQAKTEVATAKAALDAEVQEQRRQASIMNKQKRDAEKALALVGGLGLTGGLVDATSPVARAAPRNSDGSWPSESCNQDDPTTSGCITSRTLNAYREVKKAGFNRFVGCYRPGGPYEHPKGRACDWSLQNSGFSPAKTRDQKMYGNNLTAFLVRNADRLGIYYVIWYKQIWFPATGWKSYSGASDHTDHVHMSML